MTPSPDDLDRGVIDRAAAALRRCFDGGGAFIAAAGAGMGVDSGLPDFRGPQGFWKAYPPYAHLGLSFADLASPRGFQVDPTLAWGFYGHRFDLYRKTVPHQGYVILKSFAQRAAAGSFVFTSNVDEAFQKSGFADDRICEVHGSINTFQCTLHAHRLWRDLDLAIAVDPARFRAAPPYPSCPDCGAIARPNILMFGDANWDDTVTGEQLERLQAFLDGLDAQKPHVIVECGAGRAIPTVRGFSEQTLRRFPQATLVRINVREEGADDDDVGDRVIGVAAGAKAGLVAISDLC